MDCLFGWSHKNVVEETVETSSYNICRVKSFAFNPPHWLHFRLDGHPRLNSTVRNLWFPPQNLRYQASICDTFGRKGFSCILVCSLISVFSVEIKLCCVSSCVDLLLTYCPAIDTLLTGVTPQAFPAILFSIAALFLQYDRRYLRIPPPDLRLLSYLSKWLDYFTVGSLISVLKLKKLQLLDSKPLCVLVTYFTVGMNSTTLTQLPTFSFWMNKGRFKTPQCLCSTWHGAAERIVDRSMQ